MLSLTRVATLRNEDLIASKQTKTLQELTNRASLPKRLGITSDTSSAIMA